MTTLDVHVLTLPGLPREWVEQRRASIASAVERAGFAVHVHEVEGIDGHLGRSRRKGYAAGTAPYVTHVDHDDWVAPEAFAVLQPYLEAGQRAVTTGETLVYPDGSTVEHTKRRHHLAVYRRDWLWPRPFERFEFYPDQFILREAAPSHLEQAVYFHRLRTDSASRQQRDGNREAASREAELLDNHHLLYAEALTREQIEDACNAQ